MLELIVGQGMALALLGVGLRVGRRVGIVPSDDTLALRREARPIRSHLLVVALLLSSISAARLPYARTPRHAG